MADDSSWDSRRRIAVTLKGNPGTPNMMKHILAALVLAITLGTNALAVPTIVVGSHPNFLVGESAWALDLFVSGLGPGADAIVSLDLFVSIGSEQIAAPPGEPKIAGVDVVTGTIFSVPVNNSANPAPGQELVSSDQVWEMANITASGELTQNGKIATIYINSNGVNDYTIWDLRVFNVLGEFNSSFGNSQVLQQNFEGSNGTLASVPEPGGLMLAALGVVTAASYRRIRRASVVQPHPPTTA